MEASSWTPQWDQGSPATACAQGNANPPLPLPCSLQQPIEPYDILNSVRVAFDGGTRNPWFSYGLSHTQRSTNLDTWGFTEARLRLKTSSALSWNLAVNHSDQFEIWQQNLSARWVVDPRSSVSLGLVNSSDLGVSLQAGYEWRLLHQLELNTALQISPTGAWVAGLRVLVGF